MQIVKLEQKIFTDQTGRFPITSSLGNKYVMTLFDKDTNSINVEPLKNKSQEELTTAQIKLYTYLEDRGFRPKVQILENECPAQLIKHFTNKNNFYNSLV